MRKQIMEHAKHIEITGFRNIKIDDPELWVISAQKEQQGAAVQYFDANLIATWEHLYFAALNALTAFATQKNISRNVAMEMMLFASAQRQIRKAIEFIGLKHGDANVAVVIVGNDSARVEAATSIAKRIFGKEFDESVLEISESKFKSIRSAFGVTDEEVKTVVKENNMEQTLVSLIIERMALLSTRL